MFLKFYIHNRSTSRTQTLERATSVAKDKAIVPIFLTDKDFVTMAIGDSAGAQDPLNT